MKKRKILLIENQFSQFKEIYNRLYEFEVFPPLEEYGQVMDLVRVFLNERYPPQLRSLAETHLKSYVKDNQFDLYIIDYRLTGCHDGRKGDYLASKLRGFQSAGITVPVLFLSGHPKNEENVLRTFEDMPEPKAWVEKGYASSRIIDNDYFDLHVLSAIRKMLGASKEERIYEQLMRLKNDPRYEAAFQAFTLIETEYKTSGEFSMASEEFIKEIMETNLNELKLQGLANSFIQNNRQ